MCIVQIQGLKEPFLVDIQAYYLLCKLQHPKLEQESLARIMNWLVEQKLAIRMVRNPTYLILVPKDESKEEDEEGEEEEE